MRFRRRFEVVVEGESGSAVSQRSVISEHRSEREAREAAALERRRLEVIRAEEAASWVITVMRGDEVLHEERPFEGRRDSLPESPLGPFEILAREGGGPSPIDVPVVGGQEPADDDDEDASAEAGAAADAGPADDREGSAAEAVPPAEDAESPGRDPREAGGPTAAAPPDAAPAEPGASTHDDASGATGSMPRPPAPDAEAPDADADETAEEAQAAGTGRPTGRDSSVAPRVEDLIAPDDAEPGFLGGGHPGGKRDDAERDGTPSGREPDAGAGEAPRRQSPGRRDEGEVPRGRVPEDVIRRFEESIARERERNRRSGED